MVFRGTRSSSSLPKTPKHAFTGSRLPVNPSGTRSELGIKPRRIPRRRLIGSSNNGSRRRPTRSRLPSRGRFLSFARLDRSANRIAATLRSFGVGPEIPVGNLYRRFPEISVGVFAILKAGGVYVPLDPDLPADRLAFLLEDHQSAGHSNRRSHAGRAGLSDADLQYK